MCDKRIIYTSYTTFIFPYTSTNNTSIITYDGISERAKKWERKWEEEKEVNMFMWCVYIIFILYISIKLFLFLFLSLSLSSLLRVFFSCYYVAAFFFFENFLRRSGKNMEKAWHVTYVCSITNKRECYSWSERACKWGENKYK